MNSESGFASANPCRPPLRRISCPRRLLKNNLVAFVVGPLEHCRADGSFAMQDIGMTMQSYFSIFAAVVLLTLYFRRQVRAYQERQVS